MNDRIDELRVKVSQLCEWEQEDHNADIINDVLETLKRIQQDYVLVPREPTEMMQQKGELQACIPEAPRVIACRVYKAMIGAIENDK